MRRIESIAPALVVLGTCGFLLWSAPTILQKMSAVQTVSQVRTAREALNSDDILERLNRAIRAVADSVEPSVVHIDVRPVDGMGRGSGATGSGWIFSEAGHVVTNAHVVRNARQVTVQLHDARLFRAELVGIDPFTDIAVLKVDAPDLVPIARATGERVYQGERVFAFGSPFGFKFSMSEGIVSGLGRAAGPTRDSGGFTNFIQTDAAVNPGNSGGPLVDVKGRVVGMNVAIATARDNQGSTEGQSSGISFAIPLATIENVVSQLIDSGRVRRGFLGIGFGGMFRMDDSGERGVVVGGVNPGGPADQAGLRGGDIVSAINGEKVTNVEVMRSLISNVRPGDVAKLKVERDGETLDIAVTTGEMSTEILVRWMVDEIEDDLGLMLRNRESGAVVSDVRPGSRAALAGVEEDAIVTAVGGRAVSDAVGVVAAIIDSGFYSGRDVELTLRVEGEEQPRTRTLRLMR